MNYYARIRPTRLPRLFAYLPKAVCFPPPRLRNVIFLLSVLRETGFQPLQSIRHWTATE